MYFHQKYRVVRATQGSADYRDKNNALISGVCCSNIFFLVPIQSYYPRNKAQAGIQVGKQKKKEEKRHKILQRVTIFLLLFASKFRILLAKIFVIFASEFASKKFASSKPT